MRPTLSEPCMEAWDGGGYSSKRPSSDTKLENIERRGLKNETEIDQMSSRILDLIKMVDDVTEQREGDVIVVTELLAANAQLELTVKNLTARIDEYTKTKPVREPNRFASQS